MRASVLALLLLTGIANADVNSTLQKQLLVEQNLLTDAIKTVEQRVRRHREVFAKQVTMLNRLAVRQHPGVRHQVKNKVETSLSIWRRTKLELADLDRAQRGIKIDLERLAKEGFPTPPPLARPVSVVPHQRFETLRRRGVRVLNTGLSYKLAPGTKVVAAAAGEVASIGELDGSSVVIIDHGDYSTIYSGIRLSEGVHSKKLNKGTVIGVSEGALHFELRANVGPAGVALNPEKYFSF